MDQNGVRLMLQFLDLGFVLFHSGLVLFNVIGWAFSKTRRLHLVVISLTISSWVGLGYFFGFGYCPSTDWHWDVKRSLGEQELPASWMKYYADYITGRSWDVGLIDMVAGIVGVGALLLSVGLSIRDHASKRRDLQ